MAAHFIQEPQRPHITRGKAVLEADRITFDPDTQVSNLSGNIVATYDQTKLTCAQAVIDQTNGEARFTEGVKITDPIGTLTATEVVLRFGEELTSGYAKGIVLDAYEAHFEGEELTMEKDAWRLKNAWFSTCTEHYRLLLTDIVIRPGRYVYAKRSGFQLGNSLRVPIPFFRVGLNPKETGIQSPVPSIDENFELGYRWDNVLTFGDKASFTYGQKGKVEAPPSTKIELSYSLLNAEGQPRIQVPRSMDRERFVDGIEDNVTVRRTSQDEVGDRRLLLFAGRSGNVTTRARPGTPVALDKDWYAGIEAGGKVGKVLTNLQITYGAVKERLAPSDTKRIEGYATAIIPDIVLGKFFSLRFRADLGLFEGEGTSYGWLRPMATLVAKPSSSFTFAASYFSASAWGTALFDNDRLYSKRAIHLRGDFDFPSTDLSILLKYDLERKRVYDVEFALSQIADCITPFVSYRQFPGSFAVGFTLRADRLLEALKNRTISRDNIPPPSNR